MSITSCMTQSFKMRGRARRSEFWWFQLFTVLVVVLGGFVASLFSGSARAMDSAMGSLLASAIMFAWALAILVLIPANIAVEVRRLHDLDRSGGWFFLRFIPMGPLVLLVFNCTQGTPGPNRYGLSPKGEHGPAVQPAFAQVGYGAAQPPLS